MKQTLSSSFDPSQVVTVADDHAQLFATGRRSWRLLTIAAAVIVQFSLAAIPLVFNKADSHSSVSTLVGSTTKPIKLSEAEKSSTPHGSGSNSANAGGNNAQPDNSASSNPGDATTPGPPSTTPPYTTPPPAVCPAGQTGTPPNCVTPVPPPPGWSWPATLSNTGPAAGTSFSYMAPREFDASDNGKTFNGVQINVGNGQEIYITGSNITFKNCKIIYTGSNHLPNGFLFIGKSWLPNIRPKNILFDHCIIDSGDRHEYGLTVRHGQFSIQYSQVRGASHNIEVAGDLDAGTAINIYRNYIYDYNDDPYASPAHVGHANGIYFTGNNGTANIEENTVIGNRWEQCAAGWAKGPGAGCYELYGTSAVTVYADEDANPDKVYIVKHNLISGGGYYAVRFYSGSASIQSISITQNVFTAQAGWPQSTDGGGLYVINGSIGSLVKSGNSWGSDTTCFVNPGSCAGSPN